MKRRIKKDELQNILEKHKKWLLSDGKEGERADLRYADLRYAYLRSADLSSADLRYAYLRSADLDYSSFQLFCGGLNVHIDDRIAIQILYHLIKNVKFSKNTSSEIKKILESKTLIKMANKFHRVNEIGEI